MESEEVGEVLIENVITKYCVPEYIIINQDSSFMSSVITYLFNKFNITIRDSSTIQSPISSS